MTTVVRIPEAELSELKEHFKEKNEAKAIRKAVAEYLRYLRRKDLIKLSGRVVMQDDWHELEEAELSDARQRSGSGSRAR
jgi:hypothetical protein